MGGPGSRRPPNRSNGAGRGPSGPAGRAPRSLPPPTGGGSCLLVLIVAALVVAAALVLTPLTVRVWTTAMVPAANRLHYGDALTPALALAGMGLYLIVSVLITPRRTHVLVAARGEPCSEDPAAGVASPGHTPAAATTAAAVSSNAAADGTDIASQRAGRRPLPAAGRHVTPGGAA